MSTKKLSNRMHFPTTPRGPALFRLLHILKHDRKVLSKYYDPCQEAADRSLRCVYRNNGDRDLCQDYFKSVDPNPPLCSRLKDGFPLLPLLNDAHDKTTLLNRPSEPIEIARKLG